MKIECWTDGGCVQNPGGPGGAGAYIEVDGEPTLKAMQLESLKSTNNRAEMYAVIMACEEVAKLAKDLKEWTLWIDSQYVIGIIRNLPKYSKNGYMSSYGSPLKNQDLIIKLKDALELVNKKPKVLWVKGHSDVHGNEVADQLATMAQTLQPDNRVLEDLTVPVVEAEPIVVEEEPAGKKKRVPKPKEPVMNPLLGDRRFYHREGFMTNIGDYFVYCSTFYKEHKDDKYKDLAKPQPQSQTCLLVTPNEEPALKKLIVASKDMGKVSTAPWVFNLSQIRKKSLYPNYLTEEAQWSAKGNSFFDTTGEEIGKGLLQPRLCFDFERQMTAQAELLERFTEDKLLDNSLVIDITDHFLETSDKGKVSIRKDWKVGDKATSIAVKSDILDSEVILTYRVDMPIRNQFSAMLKEDKERPIKITLLLTDIARDFYRLDTVVQWGEDIAIYGSPQSGNRIIKPVKKKAKKK